MCMPVSYIAPWNMCSAILCLYTWMLSMFTSKLLFILLVVSNTNMDKYAFLKKNEHSVKLDLVRIHQTFKIDVMIKLYYECKLKVI